jgi:hypothetical protein
MKNIRITKSPKTGDQRDYSLVHRQVHYIGEGNTNAPVKNTMGAVPIEEANIEVEGGETVVGDVNRDGFLEHMTFVGKRHSNGGMPVNIPEGSFIFSDTKKLKIKDKEILKEVFGMGGKAGGYTPAEIAKRYQINQYIQDLKNPDADAITKRSATQMLANNMEKLGMLALVQESMKGFPDGVPAIADSVMAGLQPEGEAEMSDAKYGGVKKLQEGGFNLKYTPQTTIYINNVPFTYQKHEDADFWGTGDIVTFKSEDGRYYKTNSKDLKKRIDSGKPVDLGYKEGRVNRAFVTSSQEGKSYYDSNEETIAGQRFAKGSKFYADGKLYEVEDPFAANVSSARGTYMSSPTTGIFTEVSPGNSYTPAVKVFEIDKNGKRVGTAKNLSNDFISRSVKNNTFDFVSIANSGSQNQAPGADVPGGTTKIEEPKSTSASAVTNTNTQATAPKNTAIPASSAPKTKVAKPAGVSDAAYEAFNSFRTGGFVLNQYQDAGQTGSTTTTAANQPEVQNTPNQRIDPNQEIAMGQYTKDGETFYRFYKGDQKYIKDVNGKIIMSGTRTDTQFSQYGSQNINQLLAKTPNVRYTETNFGSFGNQPRMGNTGIYMSSGNAAARNSGNLSEKEWQDFKDRHGDWVDKEYAGGFEQYKKDLIAGQETGDKAAGWFQDKINEKSMQQFGVPYFADASSANNSPYKRDSKFGQVTYSVPRFFDAPVEQANKETPKEEPKKPVNIAVGEAAPAQPRKQGPWWLQDIVNFTGTLTDRVNRYEPTQGRVELQTPGYTVLDPTRQLAANQEQMARLQEQAMNTTDGNVALASMLGASGQGFANAANVLADTENRNVGIVNQAYMTNAQINNQEAVANETGRQKYVEDMATLNQQMDNAEQQKKWRQIAAFNNGTTNWFRKKQMEQVLFPQVYIDPITGNADFSGQSRDALGPDTYSPAYADMSRQVAMNPIANVDQWNQIYQEARGTMGDQEAKRYATNSVNQMMSAQQRQVMGITPRQQFNQMSAQGLTLPVPLREYGGEMYLPWVELD